MNNLRHQKSPYLLQHADNPVDWEPWCETAFEKAKAEDKPIFLSIGYSTCHWCHVMAHESFEDKSVAAILNEYFIAIKVDREERPDVDSIYMSACQALTGSGGWPLSAFLDNEKRPFFVGTYFTRDNFKDILNKVATFWRHEREQFLAQAQQITEAIKVADKVPSYTSLDGAVESAIKYLKSNFEPNFGGFSRAPKFPSPHNILFLLKNYRLTGDKQSLDMCSKTLTAIRSGGIYDHIGEGCARYATDNRWLVPHFEKMLYDNAMLMMAYAEMYGATKDGFYADACRGIADYLQRDLRDINGGFYTAEDADSDGQEGTFYVFAKNEISRILQGDTEEFSSYYNITEAGNFEGKNILNTIGIAVPKDRQAFVNSCLKKLYDYRSGRTRPHRDEKILTSLNGLAIAAFCRAGAILNNCDYIKIAEKTVNFINANLTTKSGALLSCYFTAPSAQCGFADDYSYYIWGLLELYSATQKEVYLRNATLLQDVFYNNFFDTECGGFYISDKLSPALIARPKELYDGALPSYNAVALNNLNCLYSLTKDVKYAEQCARTLAYFSADIARYPGGYIHSISALMSLKEALPNMHICYKSACRPIAKSIDEFVSYFE